MVQSIGGLGVEPERSCARIERKLSAGQEEAKKHCRSMDWWISVTHPMVALMRHLCRKRPRKAGFIEFGEPIDFANDRAFPHIKRNTPVV
jgi:hypothetical protein